MFIGMTACLRRRFHRVCYFPPGVLVLAEGDDVGEGLTAGLDVITGALTVALGEGDDDAAGLAAAGVVDSLTGSVAHPTANAIDPVARSRSAVRRIMVTIDVLIDLFLVRARLKSRIMIAATGS